MGYSLNLDCVVMEYTNQNPNTFRLIIPNMKHERNIFHTERIFPYKVGRILFKKERIH